MEKALIYCRVSSERQAKEGHGLDSQEHRCRFYCEQKAYEVERVFRDSFSGAGDFMKRPAMSEMLSYMDKNAHKEYVVVFDDLSRFARDTEFHLKLAATFKARGARRECLNFSFDDSPEGIFAETVIAASNALDRQKNRRQVIQKQKARLEKGYWPFYPPPGYKYTKHSMHGKLLIPSGPKATIIRNAFEGYANDRFFGQIDVQKYLQENDFCDGKPVYLQKVKRLLTRIIYAGYIEYLEWEVPRRLGHHDAIISLETYEKVQSKLKDTKLIYSRKDYSETFDLRGFACCSKCGSLLTASESTGRRGIRYPYYRCRSYNCQERTKSIKKKDIDKEFLRSLRSIQPDERIIRLTRAIVEDVYEKRKSEACAMSRDNERRVEEFETEIKGLAKRITKVQSESVIMAYEARIEEIEKQKKLISDKHEKMTSSLVEVRTAFNEVMRYLENPADTWVSGGINDKKRVLKLVFAEKYIYDRESNVGTPKLSILYRFFEQFRGSKLQNVEMGGVEPPSRKLRQDDSTSLVYFCFFSEIKLKNKQNT